MSQLSEEINEKIPKKTQKIILYAISAFIVIITGLFVFRPMYTKAMESKAEAERLESTVSEYKKMDAVKEINKRSIEQYESNTRTMLSKYPRDIYPEDMIVILSDLEDLTGILFTDISVESNNYVTEDNDKTSTSTASTSTSTTTDSSTTESGDSSTATSVSTASTPVVSSEQYDLYATPVTCAFEVSYIGVKQLFTSLLSNPLKKNVESVDLSYDESSGNLLGTMVIDFYTLQYNDNTVNGHEIIPDVSRGTANVFHSIR